MTTENELIWSKVLQDKCPLLVEGARLISDPQVRYKGTIGGDISHGDPANDHPALMLALGASFVLKAASGERVVPADGFFVGTYDTLMKPDEIMTEIRIPVPAPGTGYCYAKLQAQDRRFRDGSGGGHAAHEGREFQDVAIALTNRGATPPGARSRRRFTRQGADRRIECASRRACDGHLRSGCGPARRCGVQAGHDRGDDPACAAHGPFARQPLRPGRRTWPRSRPYRSS
jgi:CO/xanthine dehydrogenase FAD-binding subunit